MGVIKLNVQQAEPILFWGEHTEARRAAPPWEAAQEEGRDLQEREMREGAGSGGSLGEAREGRRRHDCWKEHQRREEDQTTTGEGIRFR